MKTNSRSLNAKGWLATAVSLVLLLLAGTASAQWSTNGTNVFYNGGNVCIGTNSPADLLHARSTTNGATVDLVSDGFSNAERGLKILTNTGGSSTVRWKIGTPATSGGEPNGNIGTDFAIESFNLYGTSLGIPFFIERGSGNVGIGTTTPGAKLEVNGASVFAGTVNSSVGSATIFNVSNINTNSGYFHIGSAATDLYWGQESSSGGSIFSGTSANASVFGNRDNVPLQLITTNVPRLTILGSSGNVGIGTAAPGYKLDVYGPSGNYRHGRSS